MNSKSILSAAIIIALTIVVSSPVQSESPEEPKRSRDASFHRELPDDPYVPVPPVKRQIGEVRSWTYNGHVSIQVNVAAGGANIIGDAANEPSMAVDPTDPDRIAIGWRQFDTITNNFRQAGIGYSTDGGATWTFPGPLDPGIFRSDPVLDVDATGTFYYDSLLIDFHCDVSMSPDGGANWGTPVYAFGDDKQWITIDRTGGAGDGHIYQFWSPFTTATFNRSTDGASTFETPVVIPQPPRWGTNTVAPDGALYLAGQLTTDQVAVMRSSNAQNPLRDADLRPDGHRRPRRRAQCVRRRRTQPRRPARPGVDRRRPLRRPQPRQSLCARVRWTRPAPILSTCTSHAAPTVERPGATRFGSTTMPPTTAPGSGSAPCRSPRTAASTRSGTTPAQTPARSSLSSPTPTSSDGGLTWTPNMHVSPAFDPHVGWPQQDKIGDYYDMVSDETGVHIAYSATFNREQDVYYLHLDPPGIFADGFESGDTTGWSPVFPVRE